jgi:acetyl esterase/lipase
MRRARLLAVALGLAVAAAAVAAPAAPSITRDVVYGEAGGETLRLDASVPAGAGPFPVLILIHGGGWTGGDKAGDIAPLLAPLTAAGFACFSINYRLAPQHRWPACRDDVLAAVRWAKAHAARFRADGARLALVGYSAGGHLACFAATAPEPDVRVQAVVGLAPLTDFEQELPKRGHVLGRAQQGLLARGPELTPESLALLRELSPINHVRAGLPPFLLVHGDADNSVPYEQSPAFRAKLRAHGVRCDLLTLPGAPHRLSEWEKFRPDYIADIVAWLRTALSQSAPAEGGDHHRASRPNLP